MHFFLHAINMLSDLRDYFTIFFYISNSGSCSVNRKPEVAGHTFKFKIGCPGRILGSRAGYVPFQDFGLKVEVAESFELL